MCSPEGMALTAFWVVLAIMAAFGFGTIVLVVMGITPPWVKE